MKYFALYLIFIFTVSYARAQEYVPFPKSGAIWQESFQQDKDGYVYHVKQEKDTLIDSVKYIMLSTVERHYGRDQYGNFTYSFSKGLYGAMREDSNKHVFFYDLKEKKEHLLYDFNMQIGDTLPEYIRYNPERGYTIGKIDSVLIVNNYRKRYMIGADTNRPIEYIIEGIGSLQGLKNYIVPKFEVFYDLRCFSLNGRTLYPDSNYQCELIVSVEEFTKNNVQFNVFPNPTNGNFTIQTQSIFSDGYICVRDVLGRIVLQEKLQFPHQTINISNQPKGLYFVELRNGNKKSVQKLILQ